MFNKIIPNLLPDPGMIFTTPAGTPASIQISPKIIAVSGVKEAGLTITEHPTAMAGAIFQAAIIKG